MLRIIPLLVCMMPDSTRANWYRWHLPQVSSQSAGAEGLAGPRMPAWAAVLPPASGLPPWQATQSGCVAEARSTPEWQETQREPFPGAGEQAHTDQISMRAS